MRRQAALLKFSRIRPRVLIHSIRWMVILLVALSSSQSLRAGNGRPSQAGTRIGTRDRFYAPDHLVEVEIEISPRDWDAIRRQTRSFVASLSEAKDWESPFSYVRANVTIDGQRIENVAIRKKGFLGSLDSERPSLKIRFDKYEDQSPLGNLDRITLNNNKQDPSRLSQYLSYYVFRRAGVPCSRCNFAKVSVNGKSLGIYSNVEAIKPPMLEDCFGDGSGALYEGTVTDFFPGSSKRFEPKTKKPKFAKLESIANLLAEPSVTVEGLNEHLNVNAFMKYWAIESLIGFWDGYTHNQNNFYLYTNPGDKKFYFLPWGTDSSFTYAVPPIIDKIEHSSNHANATLPNTLYRNAEARQRYRETLSEMLSLVWDEDELRAEIDRCRSLLKPVALKPWDLQKAMSGTEAFVAGRRKRIEKELKEWPLPLHHGPRRPGFTEILGEVTATFDTEWSEPLFFQRGYQGDAKIALLVNGDPVELRNMKATAGPQAFKKESSKLPTITLTAQRVADNMPLTFSLTVSPPDFASGDREVQVDGVFMEGSMITFMTMLSQNPGAIKLVDGSVTLEEASTARNAPVQGKASFRIMRFAGGQKPRIKWKDTDDGSAESSNEFRRGEGLGHDQR